jgi:hypothetical protein
MKLIMQSYQELHKQDVVLLFFLFLQHFAGTTTKNIIEAYSLLSETKLQVARYNGNILDFTNAVHNPIWCLLKAKETPSIQHFLWLFQGCMEAPNEEFCNFIFTLYAKYQNNGPAKSLSMLQLLDKLDTEYNLGIGSSVKIHKFLLLLPTSIPYKIGSLLFRLNIRLFKL